MDLWSILPRYHAVFISMRRLALVRLRHASSLPPTPGLGGGEGVAARALEALVKEADSSGLLQDVIRSRLQPQLFPPNFPVIIAGEHRSIVIV